MLGQRKDALESKVAELEKQLDRMVGEQTRESRDTARKLTEAASGIRDNKIKEKIRYSKSLLGSGAPEQYARNFEEEIGANIDALRKKLDEASSSAGQQGRDRSGDALDKARELARGVDSLGRRMQERAQQNALRPTGCSRASRASRVKKASRARKASRAKEGQCGKEGQSGQQGQGGKEGSAGPAGPGRSAGHRVDSKARVASKARAASRARAAATATATRSGGFRDGGWGGGDRQPGYGYYFGPDDVRQFRGEARRWAQEGQALRNMLREQNVDPKEFDEIMKRLRELDSERVYQDVGGAGAAADVRAEGMKRFEYALRRKVGDETDRALVNGSEEVPAEFKALVEEYYRSLSKGQQSNNR